MAVQSVITITHDKEVNGDINNAVPGLGLVMPSFSPRKQVDELIRFLSQLASGVRMGSLRMGINTLAGVAATGTITCATVLANDTVTVAGQVFTAVTGGSPTSVQFDRSGTNTATAANLAAAITAHTTVGKYVKATSALGVVTLTAVTDGYIGNLISLASSGATLAVSGALLTGGAGNNVQTTTLYKFGV